MASIVGKRINGGTYYYLVESARVDGRPRIVTQRYLGSAADVAAALDAGGLGVPARTEHHAFGSVAAVWATLTRLGLPDLVDEVTGHRAPTGIGLRLALAVLHRVVAPATEFGLGDWWRHSAAPRFVRPRPDPDALAPRAFWAAMDRLTEPRLAELTTRLADRLTAAFDLDADALAVDLPAFETLTTADEHADPARLTRPPKPTLLGLSLLVSRDGMIPLAARAYRRSAPGQSDVGALLDELGDRAPGPDELTVVLEPGRPERIDELVADGRHVVTALPVTDAAEPGIPDLPTHSAYRPLDAERFPGVHVWDTRAVVSTVERRVIAVRSATLHAAQSRSFADALATAARRLDELDAALAAGTIRRTRDRLLAEVARITRARRVDRVLNVTVPEPGPLRLRRRVDETAWNRLHREVFGRQLLVTDRDDWPVEQVLTAYRARYYLDATFGQFGGPVRPAPWPGFGWTDERIAVHTLISTLAATVTHLLRLEAHRIGLDLSVRELLDCLDGMQETVLRYPSTGGRPRTVRRLTEHTPTQQRLFDAYGLRRYAPRH